MLYVVYCRDNPQESARIRSQLIDEHLRYLAQHQSILVLGGALLAEDGKTRLGSTLILNVPDRGQAVAFSENEPFRRAGLYLSVEITRMRRGQWFPLNAPQSVDGN